MRPSETTPGDRVEDPPIVTVLVNAVSARRGGGLMVYRALLSDLTRYPRHWRFVILVNGDIAEREFEALPRDRVVVEPVANSLGRVVVYLQPLYVRRAAARHRADVIVAQNFYVPGGCAPQLVLHVNVFSFLDNPALRGAMARFREALRQRAARAALGRAAVNVFESRYLRDLAAREAAYDPARSATMYVGVDGRGVPAADTVDASELRRIAVVTSDNPHKRNELLADIAARLRDGAGSSRYLFSVYGTGEWRALHEAIDERAVSDMFRFEGYVPGGELRDRIRGVLCLVSTSAAESFCSVALEAMSVGVPAIVADLSAMPESVGEAGHVVPEDNLIEGFAAEVERLHSHQGYREERVRRSVARAASLSWSRAIDEFGAIVEGILREESPANSESFS